MEQILIHVEFEPHADFRTMFPVGDHYGYGAQIWGRAGRDCPNWISAVESDPGFRVASHHTVRAFEISQGLL